MSGYYNRLKNDPCEKEFQDYQNLTFHDHVMNLDANYRPALNKAPLLSQGLQPSFWGPLRGVNVTRDSMLQGRGQTLSKCPDCGVRWLPETLFPYKKPMSSSEKTPCYRSDIQPLYTRVPRSCSSLAETDVTSYFLLPGAFQKGYEGYKAVPQTNIQGRDAPFFMGYGEPYGCQQNLGTYGSKRNFCPYM